jgi:3-oxoacyl-[acyl-carrier protein] reductase
MSGSSGKVAVVTGASGGIGRAVALRLARDGFAVVATYAGNPARAQELVAEIEAADGRAIAVPADVASAPDVDRLFRDTLEAFGRIDVVVNSAGIMPIHPIADGKLEDFDRVIATNLRGAFLVLGQAARHVSKGGRIIALSSSVIAKSLPGYGAYIASKAGVEGLVRVLANELRGHDVTVNAVAPGPVATELFLRGKTEAQIEQFAKLAPLERVGRPEDVAEVISFLAGPGGAWVNAQVLRANGGFA